jgi:hypothetical protein
MEKSPHEGVRDGRRGRSKRPRAKLVLWTHLPLAVYGRPPARTNLVNSLQRGLETVSPGCDRLGRDVKSKCVFPPLYLILSSTQHASFVLLTGMSFYPNRWWKDCNSPLILAYRGTLARRPRPCTNSNCCRSSNARIKAGTSCMGAGSLLCAIDSVCPRGHGQVVGSHEFPRKLTLFCRNADVVAAKLFGVLRVPATKYLAPAGHVKSFDVREWKQSGNRQGNFVGSVVLS